MCNKAVDREHTGSSLIPALIFRGHHKHFLYLPGFHDIEFYTLEEVAPEKTTRKAFFVNLPVVMLTIGRSNDDMTFYINIGFSVLVVVALFFMGIEIELDIVKKVLKRPIGPVIGCTLQFLFMPCVAWGIGTLLLAEDFEKLGLILVGSAPGGLQSNFWSSILGGDVNLSVTMTLISNIASFGTTTLWVWLMGSHFSGKRHIQVSQSTETLCVLCC